MPAARVGERVTANFYLFCGRRRACLLGRESLCENLAGCVGVHLDGGYAERVVLPERNAIALPDDIDPVLATTIPDAIATPVHVAHRAGIELGDRVAVIAAGGDVVTAGGRGSRTSRRSAPTSARGACSAGAPSCGGEQRGAT